ncbi:hypothetical protein EBR03_09225 [bacterium]|nr:hypothetical protein [bacterium]
MVVTLAGYEKFTFKKGLGFLFALLGVISLRKIEEFKLSDSTVKGDLLTALNCISYALFLTFSKEFVKKYDFMKDKGRAEVTKDESDAHFWRVPTWRNVALTAPYFHNGAVKTLPEAVRVMAKTQLNKDLTDTQVADIVEFLKSLTGKFPPQALPRLPESETFSSLE